jgi:23S rRNA (pseudouridine1915-N3)-methyltransferase
VKLLLASVMPRTPTQDPAEVYVERIRQYTHAESRVYRSEASLLEAVERLPGRTSPVMVFLDSRGQMFSSEDFAAWIGNQRDGGVQHLVLAVGPADGWSERARNQARILLSLGPMTLPHELARIVLAEQVYRAFTILAGHPYHAGH